MKKSNEFIVSPWFSLTVKPRNVQYAVDLGEAMNIKVGCWFDATPSSWKIKNARVESGVNASRISGSIINLPCHWTLNENEIIRNKTIYARTVIN